MNSLSRTVVLTGASNFRDLGGYRGAAGAAVRWRCLFRSDHLADLTPEDAGVLHELGVVRAVDFRGADERAAQAYAWPELRSHALAIEPTVVRRARELAQAGQPMTAGVATALMQDTYRAFVSDNTAQFAGLFALLLDEATPLVFHCTAGKDRTGFAAALVLLALGVPREVVMQDYLLTNALYRRPVQLSGSAPDEVLNVIWGVQSGFLEAALERVERDFGGVQRYLQQQLGLTDAALVRLRQRYLLLPGEVVHP